MKQVFKGPDALKNLFNPKKIPYTPLVELPKEITPHYDDGVRIYAKLMYMLPLGQIKSLAAYSMLEDAFENNKHSLGKIHTIVEASSGNTSYALSAIRKTYGIHSYKDLV